MLQFSEFADIFDLEHFKNVLADDVHIVSSLPSTHVMTRPVEEKRTPLHASPQWIRAHYLKRVRFLTNNPIDYKNCLVCLIGFCLLC